jgi:hypothetical protein
MNDLSELAKGDPIVIVHSDPRNPEVRQRTVRSAGPRWVTDAAGFRYERETGLAEQNSGYPDRAFTETQYAAHVEIAALRGVLARWGFTPWQRPGSQVEHQLTIAQMRQVAALLSEFELPPIPEPADPDAIVRVRVGIEPSWTHDHYTEVFEVTEGDIAARPASQSREDAITELAKDVVNNVCGWGAMEVDGDAEDEDEDEDEDG